MAQDLSTPGVYLQEEKAFPSLGVATAIPAFIGYTEIAIWNDESLRNKPTRITSLDEFHQFFGKAPKTTFSVTSDPNTGFRVTVDNVTKFNLYRCIRMFFSNGGSICYIVSVGNYDNGVKYSDLNDPATESGIPTLLKFQEPTMVVIPDAVLLPEKKCYQLQKDMLMHCGKDMKNRVAILDVFNGDRARTYDPDNDVITLTREGVGTEFLQWGAAYYPHVNSTIVQADEIDFSNISNTVDLTPLLNAEADTIYEDDSQIIKDEIAKIPSVLEEDSANLHQTLMAKLPMYKAILEEIRFKLNVLPPSGGMAGVISMVDGEIGVFQSPANVSLGSVVSPSVDITAKNQEDLNLPLNGKAINAIRSFPGKGVLVWGARTLDGNSQDWTYINIKRTAIMIEQSLKIAFEAYMFESNEANTWAAAKGMMTNFLTNQWKLGTLAGATPKDAFSIDIGLGVTMTPTDILDGIMRIRVKLALNRPAEFIIIMFEQKIQKSQ